VKAKARKIGVAKAKRRGSKGGEREGKRVKEVKEKEETDKREDNANKQSGRRIEDLRGERRSSEIRERSKEVGIRAISQVNQSLWQESK